MYMFGETLNYDHPSGESLLEEVWAILTDPPHLASEVVFEILSYSAKGLVVAALLAGVGYLGWKSRTAKRLEALERRIDELERGGAAARAL